MPYDDYYGSSYEDEKTLNRRKIKSERRHKKSEQFALYKNSVAKGVIGRPIKLRLLNSYAVGSQGSTHSYIETDKNNYFNYIVSHKKKIKDLPVIVGYKLKNIDYESLIYLKAIYSESGITYEKTEVLPGQEFIVTRHELGPLMFLNGTFLDNARIISARSKEGATPYIRGLRRSEYDYSDGSSQIHIQSGDIRIMIDKATSDKTKITVQPEYREKFYWVEMSKYMNTKRVKPRISYDGQ